jgi:hypothetical protein
MSTSVGATCQSLAFFALKDGPGWMGVGGMQVRASLPLLAPEHPTATIMNALFLTRTSSERNGKQLALPLFLSCPVMHVMLDARVRESGEGPAGEGCPVAEGRSKVRHSLSAVSWLDWSQLSLSQELDCARGRGFSPSIIIGRPPCRWLHRPCCPSQPPQRPFPVPDAVHLLISSPSGNAGRLSLCSVRRVFITREWLYAYCIATPSI